MKRTASIVAAAWLVTGCDWWSETTVLPFDASPPVAAARIIGGPSEQLSYGSNTPALAVTTDPEQAFIAIGAAWDPQGAFTVAVEREVARKCRDGENHLLEFVYLGLVNEEQPGAPGDVVDDGVWAGDYVEMGDWVQCPPGWQLEWVDFMWWTFASNYSGGTAAHGPAAIRYQP